MHYALGDYVLDIAQNAVEADSGLVRVEFSETGTACSVLVADDGKGMGEEELKRALDPFYTDGRKHAKRKVGLGLPFLVQGVEQAGGEFAIDSKKGGGTRVRFSFPAASPDRPPLGDLPGLFMALLTLPGAREMVIKRTRKGGGQAGSLAQAGGPDLEYELRRSELAEALGGLERADSLSLLRDFLVSQEEDENE